MSRTCDICGRGRQSGKNVSFSERKSNRTFEVSKVCPCFFYAKKFSHSPNIIYSKNKWPIQIKS